MQRPARCAGTSGHSVRHTSSDITALVTRPPSSSRKHALGSCVARHGGPSGAISTDLTIWRGTVSSGNSPSDTSDTRLKSVPSSTCAELLELGSRRRRSRTPTLRPRDACDPPPPNDAAGAARADRPPRSGLRGSGRLCPRPQPTLGRREPGRLHQSPGRWHPRRRRCPFTCTQAHAT